VNEEINLPAVECADEPGVYFAQAGTTNRVKIGSSKNIRKRLKQIQRVADHVGAGYRLRLLATATGDRNEERRFQYIFRSLRIWRRLEWFWLRDELLSFLTTGNMPATEPEPILELNTEPELEIEKKNLRPEPRWRSSDERHSRIISRVVRFRSNEVDIVKTAAAMDGVKYTTWIRESALLCAESGTYKLSRVSDETGLNLVVAVRFSPDEMRRTETVAAKDGMTSSAWIRSCVVEFAKTRLLHGFSEF
jgi:predicted DNA binding CopG/RHH family protein